MSEELIGGSSIYADDYREAQQKLRARSEEAARAADSSRFGGDEATVLICDDQDLVRNGFRLILSSYEFIKVVGEADNGLAAYDQARALHPDVVLMDIRMPLENGIDATRKIVSDPDLADTRVLVLTTFDIDEYVYDALLAGASGFMLKDSEPDDIAHAIRTVAAGEALIQPSITRRLIESFVETRAKEVTAATAFSVLTDREREILALIAHGMSNDEIANDLVISPATVKTHVARIMSKLDAHDRAQLVVLAYENGLVSPGQK
ncbi:MAG: response regulator transcription factor [Eggerthellaceae bacterium]|nr:response regulator transcription factor [Eggerthellaceae bacterium]